MRELVNASTDLLCIKNDIYSGAIFAGKKLNAKIARYFDDGKKRMLVIYDERAIAAIVPNMIKTMPDGPKIIDIYTFSPSRYAFR
jgi:adenine-specific DNA-methyltransferase